MVEMASREQEARTELKEPDPTSPMESAGLVQWRSHPTCSRIGDRRSSRHDRRGILRESLRGREKYEVQRLRGKS